MEPYVKTAVDCNGSLLARGDHVVYSSSNRLRQGFVSDINETKQVLVSAVGPHKARWVKQDGLLKVTA
jgi:hypothetical protein